MRPRVLPRQAKVMKDADHNYEKNKNRTCLAGSDVPLPLVRTPRTHENVRPARESEKSE